MPSALVIRRARLEDIAETTAIYAVHVQEGSSSFEVTPPDETEMAHRWEAIVAAGLPYLDTENTASIALH
jgi:phosphinothricin acetyltransferase